MNSNVCLLLSFIIVGANGGKTLMENINEFVELNIGDLLVKKNLEKQINILNDCGVNTNQFFNNLDQLIKDIFETLIQSSDDKTKVNTILNDRINNYQKVKEINEEKDKEIENLKRKINEQNQIIVYTKEQINHLKKNVNELNEFLKLNEKDGKLDVKKITKIFNGYNDKIGGLIGDIDDYVDRYSLSALNTGKYFFTQFYSNVTNFAMNLYNYGFRDDK
jgi:predicted RNase H-like nuclease (RuvC/YqgF family)